MQNGLSDCEKNLTNKEFVGGNEESAISRLVVHGESMRLSV